MSGWVIATAVAVPAVVIGGVVGGIRLLTGALDHSWRECDCVECMARRERSFRRMKQLQYELGPAPRVATSQLRMANRVYIRSQTYRVVSVTHEVDGGILVVLSHADTGAIARAVISWHKVDDPLWHRI